MAETTATARMGLGLPTVLFLVFLVLRLTGNIDWPWYAIAAPLLVSTGLWVILVLIGILIVASRRD